MAGDEHVIHVLAGIAGVRHRHVATGAIHHVGEAVENLDAGLGQFNAHHDGEETADEPRNNGEPKIHRADVLVVG